MEYRLCGQIPDAYVEILPDGGLVQNENDALDLVAACGEYEIHRLMLHAGNLPAAFYDLKTGLAGVVMLKLSNYSVKTALVITPELEGQGRFHEMALEANRRDRLFHVFYDREKAEAWLLKD